MNRRRVVEWVVVSVLVCAWLGFLIHRMVTGQSWGWMAITLAATVLGSVLGAWTRRRQERRNRAWSEQDGVTRP